MTRTDFIAAFRHKIDGWILEGCMENRRGDMLSLWLRQMRANIEVELGLMWDALQKEKDVGKDGHQTTKPGPGTANNGQDRPAAVGVGGGRPAPGR